MSEKMVSKQIEVNRSLEATFDLFTGRIGEWWPLKSHSIFEDESAEVVVEPRVGGEVYEQTSSGERGHWATILAWEPPDRLRLAWRPSPEGSPVTTWEARFVAVDGSTTRVELDHWGWELFGDRAHEVYDEYQTGWDLVLGRLGDHVGALDAA